MAMLPSGYAKLEWKKILTSPGIGEYSIVARGLLCSRCRVRRRHATRVLTGPPLPHLRRDWLGFGRVRTNPSSQKKRLFATKCSSCASSFSGSAMHAAAKGMKNVSAHVITQIASTCMGPLGFRL
jgi:hypothetical protein